MTTAVNQMHNWSSHWHDIYFVIWKPEGFWVRDQTDRDFSYKEEIKLQTSEADFEVVHSVFQ